MQSNLQVARQAIMAELEQARQGMTFYRSRIDALEAALQQVKGIDQGGADSTSGAKANGKRLASNTRRSNRSASDGRENAGASKLPKTGGDFWLGLITDTPQSAVDLATKAAAALKLTPGKDATLVRLLKQRSTPALNGLVTGKKVKDTGAGRDRRFVKA